MRLFNANATASVDTTGHTSLHMHLVDRSAEVILRTDNLATWAFPESTSWDTAGYYNVSSVLHTKLDIGWNFDTHLDYEQDVYNASVRNRNTDGSEMFYAIGDGTFSNRNAHR